MTAALLIAAAQCASIAGPVSSDPQLSEWLRVLSHQVAVSEGVDPLALEALGRTETDLRPSVGNDCELGPFQVMQSWATIFQIAPSDLWDPRINAIAAARIYKSGLRKWKDRYAALGKNRALRKAGWRGPLSREAFAAILYNWGGAARAFAHAEDLRTVQMPSSTAAYAVRFARLWRGLKIANRGRG
jgi:hypothetical protein